MGYGWVVRDWAPARDGSSNRWRRPPGTGITQAVAAADWKDIVVKRILALLAVMAAWFVIAVPVAQAAAIEITLDTVVTADEGSITVLASADTPDEIIGLACVGVARAENQPSVHPDNDLIITSGGDSIVLEDVERAPGAVTSAEGLLTLGPTVTVSLRMGPDELFSGGMVFTVEDCAPPTTTTTTTEPPGGSTTTTTTEPPGGSTTTTTTEPPGGTTTTTQASGPAIVIEKTADPVDYGDDGIGDFIIRVSNPGPVDLTDVRVTDDIAVAIDPDSDCPNPDVPDLAVGEFFEYRCSVGNLDGVSPFRNEATALGVGPGGTEVTDTDDATVLPPVSGTTITQPPSTTQPPATTTPSTLPNTGVPFEQVRGFSVAGFAFFASGIALLAAAAWIGHRRIVDGVWFDFDLRPAGTTLYIPLRPRDPND